MKLKSKILIDFQEFFVKGKFDFLKIGKTKEWIIHNFPNPDDYDNNPQVYKDNIWRYGNIELHFADEKLWLIFSDYIDTLDGGISLELDKWFMEDSSKLDLLNVISILNNENIDFEKTTRTKNETIILKLSSGIELGFIAQESEEYDINPNNFKLTSFSLK